MSTTTTPSAAGLSPNGRPAAAYAEPLGRPPDRLPQPARRRNPALAAFAVMLVAGSAAVSAGLVLASSDTTSVLTVTRRVAAGQVVKAANLGTAEVAGSGLTAVGVADQGRVVGQTAAVDLLPGTLLTGAMVTRDPVPAPGQAVVGLSLKPGLLPESELRAGSTVMLVSLPATQGGTAKPGPDEVLVPSARVLSETSDRTTGGRLVSLLVDRTVAAQVARAAAAGTVSLVVIGPGR